MVRPTNYVIAGPDLHRAGILARWRFLQDLSTKYRGRIKKSYDFSAEPLPKTAPYYGKSGPNYCITFMKRLDVGLR